MSGSRLAERDVDASLQAGEVTVLRQRIRGEVVARGDAAYDQARRVWNGRSTGAVVFCAGSDDVAQAVKFARSRSLLIAVRSGGHNIGGASVCDDGLVIDLSRMKQIEVDPIGRTARAQAGLKSRRV